MGIIAPIYVIFFQKKFFTPVMLYFLTYALNDKDQLLSENGHLEAQIFLDISFSKKK